MKKLTAIAVLMFFFSCSKAKVSESTKDFPDNRWTKADAKVFEFDLEEDIANAKLILKFSHVHEPGYNSVPLLITTVLPNGSQDIEKLTIDLVDSSGKTISNCSGDICDFERVTENVNLKKGQYKITIRHDMPVEILPNVLQLGVAVEEGE